MPWLCRAKVLSCSADDLESAYRSYVEIFGDIDTEIENGIDYANIPFTEHTSVVNNMILRVLVLLHVERGH